MLEDRIIHLTVPEPPNGRRRGFAVIDGRAYQFICHRGEGLVASELYRREDGGRNAWRAARDDGAADTLIRINALLARFDGTGAGDAP